MAHRVINKRIKVKKLLGNCKLQVSIKGMTSLSIRISVFAFLLKWLCKVLPMPVEIKFVGNENEEMEEQ